jgi:hypothetical protein
MAGCVKMRTTGPPEYEDPSITGVHVARVRQHFQAQVCGLCHPSFCVCFPYAAAYAAGQRTREQLQYTKPPPHSGMIWSVTAM